MAEYPYPPPSKVIHDPDQCLLYGAFVRAGRNALNLSQDQLALMLGINRTTLVRLEKGIPPFKRSLCLSMAEVFKKIGIESKQIDELASDPVGVTGRLDISINHAALTWNFFPNSDSTDQIKSIDGNELVPPLQKNPLRRDRPKK